MRCLQLAGLGAGRVAPNPMVGAVLVHDGRIIGEGYHQQFGWPHAEVKCLNSVAIADKELIADSTLYVSLEPCAHFGKTPPCADLIIRHGIRKVVIGCRDTFEEVDGKGIEKLKLAGIDVIVGMMEKESTELNRRFFTFQKKQRPYIILKWAQSDDGFIAANNPERIFISNENTNRLVHRWRSEEAAILVGTNTALNDNPALTARLWTGNNPVRLVIDRDLKLPGSLQLFDKSTKTIVFNNSKQSEDDNLVFQQLKNNEDVLQQILTSLYGLQLQSLIVEGGSKLLQSFINSGLWDEARVITNTSLKINDGVRAPVLKNELLTKEEQSGTEKISYFKFIQ